MDSQGRVLIESKEDMRARGVASPDIADALMLAFSGRNEEVIIPTRIGEMNATFWRRSPWSMG